jgi:tRNA (guanine37-N1)-methyltransferase
MRLYIGLLHYPVYNKNEKKIASAITNIDLHDMARLSRTYGVKTFFVVTPLEDQQRFAGRIMEHWIVGHGASYNSHRKEAIELIDVVSSFEESVEKISDVEGEKPLVVATGASLHEEKAINYTGLREILATDRTTYLMFGTAWGLHKEVIDKTDYVLEPIYGNTDYNHLSVRTATGVILDRLTGKYS